MRMYGINIKYMRKNNAQIVVIGGGPSGFMTAITAAENGCETVLVEKNGSLAKKLRISGKGRCNILNNCSVEEVISEICSNNKFIKSALYKFSPSDAYSYFENTIGIKLKTERGRRVFPQSDNANEVADKLIKYAKAHGVKIYRDRVKNILSENGRVIGVKCEQNEFYCENIALCTGGFSYPGTGSTGDGHRMAAGLGHGITEIRPSLVPLKTNDDACARLSGVGLKNIRLKAYENNKVIFNDLGEMLFAHFGLTGPLILSASAHMGDFSKNKYRISIDLKPALSEEQLDERVLRDFSEVLNKDFKNALDKLLIKALIPVIIERSGIDPEKKVNLISRKERAGLVSVLKNFDFDIIKPLDISAAIVTKGGVAVDEVNPNTMESKLVKGLYFAGEILDLDAYTGGYNLQIAWSSGRLAGLSLSKKYMKQN